MNISSIPFEVVINILDFAYPTSFSDYWHWSPALPLAQVCRLWRGHLLPKLHQTAHVLTTQNIETYSESCAYLLNGTLNATLSLGYGLYVKKIVILDSFYLPLPQLKNSTPETWTTLKFPNNMWPGVTQLHVNAYACTLPKDQKNSYLQSIPEPSSDFLKLLPNLTSIVFKFASEDYFVSALTYRVVNSRNVLVGSTGFPDTFQAFCLYLESYNQISVHYSSESTPIESLFTLESLNHLAFIDMPRSTPWSCPFGFRASDPVINLNNIKHLKLGFRDIPIEWNYDITSDEWLNKPPLPYQLQLPNLQKLVLCNCLYDLSFFAYLGRTLPQMIKHVTITGNIEDVYPVFTVLPKFCNLNVELWSQNIPDDFDMHMFFDTAFGSQSMAELATLECSAEHIPVCLYNDCWPNLVNLSIMNDVPTDIVSSLLNCLPNLERLFIAWIYGTNSDNPMRADLNTIPALEPFKTKVWRLEIGQYRNSPINDFPVENALYLTARLINLQTLIINHETPVKTSGFMDVLHEKYSHTIGVTVSFELIDYD